MVVAVKVFINHIKNNYDSNSKFDEKYFEKRTVLLLKFVEKYFLIKILAVSFGGGNYIYKEFTKFEEEKKNEKIILDLFPVVCPVIFPPYWPLFVCVSLFCLFMAAPVFFLASGICPLLRDCFNDFKFIIARENGFSFHEVASIDEQRHKVLKNSQQRPEDMVSDEITYMCIEDE